MYGPYIAALVEPETQRISPVLFQSREARFPSHADVSRFESDNELWCSLSVDERLELLQLAATGVARKHHIENSADFQIAARLLNENNPFAVEPVTIGKAPGSGGDSTLVVWCVPERHDGGNHRSVVFKPFVEVVFTGPCVLAVYTHGEPMHLLQPFLYEYMGDVLWLDTPTMGTSRQNINNETLFQECFAAAVTAAALAKWKEEEEEAAAAPEQPPEREVFVVPDVPEPVPLKAVPDNAERDHQPAGKKEEERWR